MPKAKQLGKFEYDELFEKKFRLAHRKLETLEGRIGELKGIVFKSHVLTAKALLESAELAKVRSILELVGSDAFNWHRNGELPRWGVAAYLRERDRLQDRLNNFEQRVNQRNLTWWESIRDAVHDAFKELMSLLPELTKRAVRAAATKLLTAGTL